MVYDGGCGTNEPSPGFIVGSAFGDGMGLGLERTWMDIKLK